MTPAATLRHPRRNGWSMDRAELERQLEELHGSSYGWALTCCRWDRAEAEDVLQTAYLQAFENRASYNGSAPPGTWFFGIVRNVAAERRRSRLIRGNAWTRWLHRRPDPEPPTTPEAVRDRSEACRRVRMLLERLSSRQREVLHLVFYQELTIEQAATVLGMPVGTARKHYERGKARMRRLLAEERR